MFIQLFKKYTDPQTLDRPAEIPTLVAIFNSPEAFQGGFPSSKVPCLSYPLRTLQIHLFYLSGVLLFSSAVPRPLEEHGLALWRGGLHGAPDPDGHEQPRDPHEAGEPRAGKRSRARARLARATGEKRACDTEIFGRL